MGYKQFNKRYRDLFIKKIESVFGDINYDNKYIGDGGTTQVYFPVAVSELMFRLYNLDENSFKSETARVPVKILNKDWKHKLAFLIGIIIDEGNIDSGLILIRMKNEELIKDLGRICGDLRYKTTIKTGKDGMINLYILSESAKNFYKHYKKLLEEYLEADLGYKGEKIEEFINRLDKPKRYVPGNKINILRELSKEKLTVNELAKRLNITRQGARYLVKKLVEERSIEVKSVIKFGNYEYGLR